MPYSQSGGYLEDNYVLLDGLADDIADGTIVVPTDAGQIGEGYAPR